MNLPNKLTISRFVLTAAFLVVIFSRIRFHETLALAFFVAASVTDYFDGMIARRDKLITNFGILMDPLADKILVCSAFIAFVERGLIPAWMTVVIVSRELAITGLRLVAASKSVVLAAEGYGKHKTVSQMITIVSVLVLTSYLQWGEWGARIFGFSLFSRPWIYWLSELSKWAAVTLTAFSGVMYLWRNREIYMRDL
jgi:CDP-diacylglycerol--glycerol-3-phosphate 3-phosphatidyltransferase